MMKSNDSIMTPLRANTLFRSVRSLMLGLTSIVLLSACGAKNQILVVPGRAEIFLAQTFHNPQNQERFWIYREVEVKPGEKQLKPLLSDEMLQLGRDGYYLISPSLLKELADIIGTGPIGPKQVKKMEELRRVIYAANF